MVNADKGQTGTQRQRLAKRQTDQHAAYQPRPCGRSNRVHIAQLHLCRRQRLGHQPVKMVNMGACRQFRHNTAIGRMHVNLAQHQIGQHLALAACRAAHNRYRRLIAACFKAEYGVRICHRLCHHFCLSPILVSRQAVSQSRTPTPRQLTGTGKRAI